MLDLEKCFMGWHGVKELFSVVLSLHSHADMFMTVFRASFNKRSHLKGTFNK